MLDEKEEKPGVSVFQKTGTTNPSQILRSKRLLFTLLSLKILFFMTERHTYRIFHIFEFYTHFTRNIAEAVMNQDRTDSSICLPAFYVSKAKYNLCLTVKYGPERNTFEWEHCNYNSKAQRWVKITSRERPGMMQLCHADDQKKCIIASNQMNEGIENSVMLGNFQSLAKVSSAQLWKYDSESLQFTNVEYSSCLADTGDKTSPRRWLFATKCNKNEVPPLRKEWNIIPIVDKNTGKVICANFPRLVGNA